MEFQRLGGSANSSQPAHSIAGMSRDPTGEFEFQQDAEDDGGGRSGQAYEFINFDRGRPQGFQNRSAQPVYLAIRRTCSLKPEAGFFGLAKGAPNDRSNNG